MFYEEENYSFAKLAEQEAQSTQGSLLELEAKLFREDVEFTEEVMSTEPAVEEHIYRRFEANGYDAHTDCVELPEIRQWQKVFPYLRVTGNRIVPPPWVDLEDETEGVDAYVLDDVVERSAVSGVGGEAMDVSEPLAMHEGGPALAVLGKRVLFHAQPSPLDHGEQEEEFEFVDGILEEVIAIDCSSSSSSSFNEAATVPPATTVGDDEYALTSPYACRRAEVISVLADAIWPDCVDVLLPLVRAIVRKSRSTPSFSYPEPVLQEESNGGAEGGAKEEGGMISFRSDDDDW